MLAKILKQELFYLIFTSAHNQNFNLFFIRKMHANEEFRNCLLYQKNKDIFNCTIYLQKFKIKIFFQKSYKKIPKHIACLFNRLSKIKAKKAKFSIYFSF